MDSKALSTTIASFAAKFVNELAKDKNVISSPLSAEFVLALLTLGANDPAHSELLTSLGVSDDDTIRSSFSSISSRIAAVKGVTLNVANKVYVKTGSYELNAQLAKDAVGVFNAGIEKINFDDGAAAASTINSWVEQKTNNKIKDLLSSDSLNEDTRLVLVNALYFKGNWKSQFNPRLTKDTPFHVNAQTDVNVPMMSINDNFKYGTSEALQADLLEMPYVGEEASMVIVLPRAIDGLDALLQKLAGGHDLIAEFDNMFSTKVQVSIPKFKIETEIDLLKVFPKLGINAISSRSKNGLEKILSSGEPLYVSKAVQKAFIEVNEEGAEAAAATAMGMVMLCALIEVEPPKRFVADRPFLAVIVVDGAPYFFATHRVPIAQ